MGGRGGGGWREAVRDMAFEVWAARSQLCIRPQSSNSRATPKPRGLAPATSRSLAPSSPPGLTSITLERCTSEANPVPLLLSLPTLEEVVVRACPQALSVPGDDASPPPPPPPRPRGRRSGGSGSGSAAAALPPLPLRLARVALTECNLSRAPASLAGLSALAALDLSHNPEMGGDAAACLPAGLAALPSLADLSLAHCGLGSLPPVVGELAQLTRLELAGNPLRALPHAPLACIERLAVLGAAGTRLRALPGWILSAGALRQLSLSAACLAGPPPGCAAAAGASSGGMRAQATMSAALRALSVSGGGGGGSMGGSMGGSTSSLASPISSADGGPGPAAAAGWLQHLPGQLPGLRLLRVEGALWEQAAVRNVISLLSAPGGAGALRLELLP
jgi:hypothetical protein